MHDNPVNPGLFDLPAWRTIREARSLLGVKITGHPDRHLDTDPQTLAEQLDMYKREIVKLGWPLNGKESCYLLWELLAETHWETLQYTPGIQAMRHGRVGGEPGWSPTQGVADMITALRTTFGDIDTQNPDRDNLTTTFSQEPGEATRAFAERIERRFARDLGGGWEGWTKVMHHHFIKRFLMGMLESTYHHPANTQDVGYLADLSWSDQTIGPEHAAPRHDPNENRPGDQ